MKIEFTKPPNYEKIAEALPGATEKGVIFCYGDTIYVPSGGVLPEWLVAHEEVHSARQGGCVEDVELWWDNYIADKVFRFEEELPAHIREFEKYRELVKDREQRSRYLHKLAIRLAGPLYGRLITYMQAKKKIVTGL